ncbi:hypothetical protein QBC46DRAFT_429903 [Diplogelasinospora grovesii]|uniref:Uncharacterized protein n=1 Tax=Diplogelasinospora grovesii TaxID=303347 RepID=A0AAN6NGS1_9PEZI|nr:hypothetical protein QBC46DRAFT_429903 [Diplogelasinospora grovesii]
MQLSQILLGAFYASTALSYQVAPNGRYVGALAAVVALPEVANAISIPMVAENVGMRRRRVHAGTSTSSSVTSTAPVSAHTSTSSTTVHPTLTTSNSTTVHPTPTTHSTTASVHPTNSANSTTSSHVTRPTVSGKGRHFRLWARATTTTSATTTAHPTSTSSASSSSSTAVHPTTSSSSTVKPTTSSSSSTTAHPTSSSSSSSSTTLQLVSHGSPHYEQQLEFFLGNSHFVELIIQLYGPPDDDDLKRNIPIDNRSPDIFRTKHHSLSKTNCECNFLIFALLVLDGSEANDQLIINDDANAKAHIFILILIHRSPNDIFELFYRASNSSHPHLLLHLLLDSSQAHVKLVVHHVSRRQTNDDLVNHRCRAPAGSYNRNHTLLLRCLLLCLLHISSSQANDDNNIYPGDSHCKANHKLKLKLVGSCTDHGQANDNVDSDGERECEAHSYPYTDG